MGGEGNNYQVWFHYLCYNGSLKFHLSSKRLHHYVNDLQSQGHRAVFHRPPLSPFLDRVKPDRNYKLSFPLFHIPCHFGFSPLLSPTQTISVRERSSSLLATTQSRIQTYNLLVNLSFKPKLYPQKTLNHLPFLRKCRTDFLLTLVM